MKHLRWLLLLAVLPLMPATVSTVVFTWKASPLNAGSWPPCGTVTESCITGQTLSDVTNASSPIVLSATIPATATSFTLSPLPTVGQHVYALTYNALDQSGNPVVSSPDQATVSVPSAIPNHPVALTIVFK